MVRSHLGYASFDNPGIEQLARLVQRDSVQRSDRPCGVKTSAWGMDIKPDQRFQTV